MAIEYENDNVIETRDLGKTYENGVVGIAGLSLTVKQGEIFGLLGPNGAGKTTTVRLLNGTLTPTTGRVRILGDSKRPEEIRRRTATLAEQAQMYEHMTVAENLRFFGTLYDMKRQEIEQRIATLLNRLNLSGKEDLKLGSFSTGMRKRVQLARTLLHRPSVLFLDEPTSGLDPEGALHVVGLIRELAEEEHTTVVLCTHNLPLAERICDTYGLLDHGRVAACGSREQLFASVLSDQTVRITSDRGTEIFRFAEEREINNHIRLVMDRGEAVTDVTIVRPSLEDVYFHYVGEKSGDEDRPAEPAVSELRNQPSAGGGARSARGHDHNGWGPNQPSAGGGADLEGRTPTAGPGGKPGLGDGAHASTTKGENQQ